MKKETKREAIVRIGAAGLLGALAVARVLNPEWGALMDATFFAVIGVALLLLLVPVSRLRQLKAGGIEVALDRPEVSGAIGSLDLARVEDAKLRNALGAAQTRLDTIRGSRVLWIDDHPEKIVALRRLLRALGVDVISAVDSDAARRRLTSDGDFDLVISDVQREGVTHEQTGGVPFHEGTNFVVWMRSGKADALTRSLPVIFYAAYDWERLVEFTRPARETRPEPAIANSVPDFIEKVVQALTTARAAPLRASGTKEPTSVRRDA